MPEPKKNPTMTTKLAQNSEVTYVGQPASNEYDNEVLEDVGSQVVEVVAEATKVGEKVDIDKIMADAEKEEHIPTHAEDVAFAIKSGRVNVNKIDPNDLDNFMAESIVARPLRLPSMLDVRAKDPTYRLRWVNFKSQGGARYNEMVSAGFTKAQPQDVQGLSTEVMIKPEGITYNDVLLMKIPTATLFGWYKHNALRSLRMISAKGAHAVAKQQSQQMIKDGVNSEYSQSSDSVSASAKGWTSDDVRRSVEAYVPGEKDFDRIEKML